MASIRPQRLVQLSSTATRLAPLPLSATRTRPSQCRANACLVCRHLTKSTRPFEGGGLRPTIRSTTPTTTTVTRLSFTRHASVKSSSPNEQSVGDTDRAGGRNNNTDGLTGLPDLTNYYTIFARTIPTGPPPASAFEITPADLRREFLQLQSGIHPDKYPAGPLKQRAEALSARINEAYRTLLDPLQRAQYLLREWHGVDVTAEDGATKHALDRETLMEVMEVQEAIEEAGAQPEAETVIAALQRENEGRIAACVATLGDAFSRSDIETARQECVRLRFWYSIREGLREWEPGRTEIRLVH